MSIHLWLDIVFTFFYIIWLVNYFRTKRRLSKQGKEMEKPVTISLVILGVLVIGVILKDVL
jgi:hypothetical protein